ncbi:MAG: class I SAM-dependent methyltransferase [Cumulibacter sp.]
MYSAAIANQHFIEDDVFTRLITNAGGAALELGSGTGRLMLRLLAAGYQVEGVEISDEMIAECLAEADRLGLKPVVHHGSFAPLDESLSGYSAIYCPLNAFSFIIDDDMAVTAVRSYVAALNRGGVLALAGSAGDAASHSTKGWVRRADVPLDPVRRAEVKERRVVEAGGRCLRVERIIRIVAADGTLIETSHGTQLRRLRSIAELAQMFAAAKLGALHGYGDDSDYILSGRKG